MRIIHRYLLGELALNAVFSFGVLTSVMAMLLFSIVALKQSLAALPISALLEIVALMSAHRLDVLVPMSILIACVWTYGRAQADGEITAMRGAGIRIGQIMLPAIALGALGCTSLVWLQDEIIPQSHYRQRLIGKRFLADNIQALLLSDKKAIEDKKFSCIWSRVTTDEDGYQILEDVVVFEKDEKGGDPVRTRAKVASPRLDSTAGVLVLKLRGVVSDEGFSSDEFDVKLDLRAISEEPAPSRRETNLSYEELLTEHQRHPDQKSGQKSIAAYHRRGANAVAALMFALLGAPLGLVLRITNRAFVFLIGFLLVLLMHFGPLAITFQMARSGDIPAIGIWLGDLILLGVALVILGKARKR